MNYIQSNGGCPQGTIPYIIKTGDTLYKIAQKHNTTVNEILALNTRISPDMLYVGQTLCIPQGTVAICPTSNFYVVQRGDTLSVIARLFNMSTNDLLVSNPGVAPEKLAVGQSICIPASALQYLITISLNARTLSFYKQGTLVKTYPVAIGKPSTPSPTGNFTIINKQVNPGGPYGTRWMGLSIRGYGIHGTNNPSSIGTAASNGCIRMHNQNVNELFSQVLIGTAVKIYRY